jgi:hypothetical protein
MSLLRLLTSGRSLVGLKDSVSRYRMREKNPLPKFGSSRNPFLAQSGAGDPAPASAAVGAQPAGVQMTPAELAAARLKETARLPVMTAKPEPEETPATVPAGGLFRRMSGWVRRLNPFLEPAAHRASERVMPAPGHRPAFQAELSLENVQVVRNDLSDADVEIVSAEEAARRKAAPVLEVRRGGPLAALRSH